MKTIQVRNVPDDVHRELRSRAAAADRSLSDFALTELEPVARRLAGADLLKRARSRAGGVPSDVIVAAVRSGRERPSELRHNLTAYDAAFVALAETLGAPLVPATAASRERPGHAARIELFATPA